jgi:hypothetical protein
MLPTSVERVSSFVVLVVVVVVVSLGVALLGGEDGAMGILEEDMPTFSPTAPPTSERFSKLVNILEPDAGMAL